MGSLKKNAWLLSILTAGLLITALQGCSSGSNSNNPPASATSSSTSGTILYAATYGGDNIEVFSIDSTKLSNPTLLQTIPSGGSNPNALIVHPSKKFLVALNYNSQTAVTFGIDQGTGLLTELSTSSAGPYAGVFTSDGKYFYSTAFGSKVSGFSFDSTTGILTALTGSPFSLGGTAFGAITVTHDNALLFLSDTLGGKVIAAKIAANGSLTASGTPNALPTISALVVSPDNKYLYALNSALSGAVTTFQITDANGNISAIFGIPSMDGVAMILNSAGTRIYDVNSSPEAVTSVNVNATTGAVAFLAQSSVGGYGRALALDPSEKILAVAASMSTGVAGTQDGVTLYNFDSAGNQGAVGYIPFAPNSQPSAVAFVGLP